jgi:hypothetical protein
MEIEDRTVASAHCAPPTVMCVVASLGVLNAQQPRRKCFQFLPVLPPSSQLIASSSVIWTETESWTRLRIDHSPSK